MAVWKVFDDTSDPKDNQFALGNDGQCGCCLGVFCRILVAIQEDLR